MEAYIQTVVGITYIILSDVYFEKCRLLGCDTVRLLNRRFEETYRLRHQGEGNQRVRNSVTQ
jgi:hypothetical protein